jgi:hypothetical protein
VQGRIFERLFKAAEIKQLTSEEMETPFSITCKDSVIAVQPGK